MLKHKESFGIRMLTFLIGMLLPLCVSAQQINVQGTVKDAVGGVPGASVIVKGTTDGTIADIDGKFSINVPAGAVLEVSCIGYVTVEVPAGNGQTPLTIVLNEDTELLEEVVVVGYGTMKKSDLTGAVAAVNSDKIKDSPAANVGQALQGKVAGVQIIDSGSPGSNVNIKVRGLGSINNCDPLVVIDGVPTDLGLNAINTEDIERIDVLKDASATAIYGSRGANGVVMVTTKRGKSGDGKISVNANFSLQTPTNVPQMLNAAQYAQLSNEMMANSGRNTNPDWADPASLGAGTNWLGELLGTGRLQKYNVSYSGGNDKTNYYVSGGFLDQTGVVRNVGYRRFTFQSNSDTQVRRWLKMSTNITFSTDTKSSGSYSIGDTMNALPVFAVKDADGEWTGPEGNAEWYGSVRNPIGTTEVNKSETKGYNILANISAEISFTKWLKFKSTFGYDAKFWFTDSFTPKYAWKPIQVEVSKRYRSDNKSFTNLWDNYFLFDHTFAKKHHLSMMAGTSAQWNSYDYMSGEKSGFLFDSVNQMDNGQEVEYLNGSKSEWSLMSLMARVNYSYDDRYLITATIRRDGSSRFGRNNRWGTFPSVSVAWRPSKESWFPENNVVNDLKIRGGYGVTGSQASVSNYGYLATYDTGVYSFGTAGTEQPSLYSASLANPSIHWEEVAQSNIGIDLAMFNSRVQFSVDGYIKNTRDMLVKASIPITSGFEDTTTTYANAGKVRNQGVEMQLHTVNIAGEWNWETDISATYNTNKIIDLNSAVPYYINQVNNSYLTMLQKGYPINVFYGYVTDGLFQNQTEVDNHAFQPGAAPGDIRFRDLNNDGVINEEDRTVIGNPNPTWLFSMNNTVEWKGLELSVYLQGVAGNSIYNANNIENTGMAAAMNQTAAVLDRWTGEGTSNFMPRAVYGDPNQNCRVSDRFIENGSYLRVKNIMLAYSFPSRMLQKIHVHGLRLSLICENVATISKYSGFDPEVSINGIDQSRYPIPRTYSVGLNINF
ncbi:MAG: TonB-dependent receptor [Bacteroidales bacterium]|nr:TonB-dependent receptor [Bacteroidales bacterium]